MSQRILVIDPDVAFATLLKEGLEQKAYQVIAVHDGQAALDALATSRFDLAILDMGLTDQPALQVAQSARAQQPQLPLMIIPLDGDTIPPEIGALGVNGVLTKPFFLPELPDKVARVMTAQPQAPSAPAPRAKPSSAAPAPAHARAKPGRVTQWTGDSTELTARLSELARELNAETVLLTLGNDLIAHAGRFARQEAEQLARVIIESWHASSKVAQLLGREKVRFEQSMQESEDSLLYSLSVAEDVVLTVALNASTPLGIIRYHTKRVAETIGKMLTGA